MDQDFFKDIEPSSMSVDDILREFYAQEQDASPRKPRESTRPVQPARRETAPVRREPPARPSAPARRFPWQRAEARPIRQEAAEKPEPAIQRGETAETENAMDKDAEMEQRGREDSGRDQELLGLLGDLFARPESSEADSAPAARRAAEEAPAETVPVDSSAENAAEPADSAFSLEDIMSEYGRVFAEKPVEAPEEPAAETQFFTPKKPAPQSEERASAADYAAYAAGTSAVASSREKISTLSSMAEEAMRYMRGLTDEDYDRMAADSSAQPAPSKRDAGAERFNLEGHESKMVFGDKELDLSPDENYVPPAQSSEPIYHWTAGEEDLPDVPEEKPCLLQRIMSFNGSRRKSGKRALNDTARRSRRPFPVSPAAEAETPKTEAEAPKAEAPAGAESVSEETRIFETQPAAETTPAEKEAPASTPLDFDFHIDFDDTETEPAAYAPDKDYAPEEYPAEGGDTPEPDASPAAPVEEEGPSPAEDSVPAEGEEPAPEKRPFQRKRRKTRMERVEEEIPLDENGEFPSFTQYVAHLITGTLYRLRGTGADPGSVTMDTEGEELGAELSPAEASKYYGSFVSSLRMRFRIGLVLLAVLAWISLGLPVSGMLRTVRVAAAMCLGIQLVIMLLNLDVITNAAVNLTRLYFGADSLAVLVCVLTSFDALAVALDAFGSPHMPLCLLSSLSLMGVLYSSYLSARGLRKALRVPSIAKYCSAVTGEANMKGKGITLLKTSRPITGFVRRTEEAAPDETIFLRVSPLLLILCLVLAALVSAVCKAGGDFLYIFTALLIPAVPVSALLCFALPYFIGSNRIFYSGAAVAGWSGLSDVGRSQNLIITDRDLFPEGSVEIDTVRIFADADPERILSYAGTMILASGAGISSCFAELMNRNGGSMRQVDDFEILPGGGMKGIIDGSTVLCGSTELMRLMNVRIPYRLVDKTTVLLAVDGVLYGIFNMKYSEQSQVHKALVGLIRSSRHPVFAVRDFNVNPEMLREIFDVATDGYDFPPYLERFKLSEAPEGSEAPVAAVVCREGLGTLSQMADTGRSMYLATRFNLIVTLIAAVLGVFAVFIRFLNVGSVSIGFLLLFAILWALPVAAASLFLKY